MRQEQYKKFECYSVLGIHAAASPLEIKKAYYKAQLTHHPDHGGTHEASIKINVAFEVLSDPVSRQAHDIFWKLQNLPVANKTSKAAPLSKLKDRILQAVKDRQAEVWHNLDAKAEATFQKFQKDIRSAQNTTFWLLGIATCLAFCGKTYPLSWLPAAICAWNGFSNLKGIKLGGMSFKSFGADIGAVRTQAREFASSECKKEAEKFEAYISSFSSLYELLIRPSSFDDSEEQVARRLSAGIFLMGYKPTRFDAGDRTILFTDGEERTIVRFRHRDGNVSNVTYVEKLKSLMSSYQAKRGLLFCSPGLSGNAADFADKNKINHYSLEQMNEWITNTLASNYSGPAGDILANIDELRNFLGKIAPQLSSSPRRAKRQRYRHYR